MSTLSHCPSSISSADHGVVHPPKCPEGWFWRGCRVAHNMPKPCEFPSLNSCLRRFLWASRPSLKMLFRLPDQHRNYRDLLTSGYITTVSVVSGYVQQSQADRDRHSHISCPPPPPPSLCRRICLSFCCLRAQLSW